jgi:hypothetical protein
MKKLILISALLVAMTSNLFSQCYDGITQPTKWRFWTPISFDYEAENRGINAVPFMGYKVTLADWVSLTPVVQYNIGQNNLIPQVWANFNYKKKFWFLFRTGYDVNNAKFYETISGTWKAPHKFMLDFTWSNFYKGGDLLDTDKLQILAGRRFDNDVLPFVFNIGYRVRSFGEDEGIVTNLRLLVSGTNWLQFKYDVSNKTVVFSTVIQFN